jgi:hypothetical protein
MKMQTGAARKHAAIPQKDAASGEVANSEVSSDLQNFLKTAAFPKRIGQN